MPFGVRHISTSAEITKCYKRSGLSCRWSLKNFAQLTKRVEVGGRYRTGEEKEAGVGYKWVCGTLTVCVHFGLWSAVRVTVFALLSP